MLHLLRSLKNTRVRVTTILGGTWEGTVVEVADAGLTGFDIVSLRVNSATIPVHLAIRHIVSAEGL